MTYDIVISGGSAVVGGRGLVECDIAVEDGRIAAIAEPGAGLSAGAYLDAWGQVVLPGAIDTHVHWGHKGDFVEQCRAESRAALVGGTTTMHLLHRAEANAYLPTLELAKAHSAADFFLTPSVWDERTAACVGAAVSEWGCPSIKFYLGYRDLPDAPPADSWNQLTDGLMLEALGEMSRAGASLACVHAENAEIINRAWGKDRRPNLDGLAAWEALHPEIGEVEAILRASLFAEEAGVPLYIVHLSGRRSLEALERARTSWPYVYGETCPHYLVHNIEESSSDVKFSPPVRRPDDNDALWQALAAGTLDCVGSDSASTLRAAKQGDVFEAMRGGPGQGTLLPIVLSEGVRKGRITLERAVEVTSTNAARIFGLYPRKGVIQVGSDADLVLVDLDLERSPTPELLGTWSDHNLYSDFSLQGWPVLTMLRGQIVCRDFQVAAAPGSGRYLERRAGLSGPRLGGTR